MLKGELGRGERLLWSGQPRRRIVFRASEFFMTPFALMWGGFAIFWEWHALTAPNAPPFFALWGIPFLLIGFHLIFGRFLLEIWQRSKTYYGVTNERVLIVSGLFKRNVKSLSLRNLPELSVSEGSNGVGTISFGGGPFSSMFTGSAWPGTDAYTGPRFDQIANVKSVYETLRVAQREVWI